MTKPTLFLVILGCAASVAGQLVLNTAFQAGVTEGSSISYVSAVQPDGKVLIGGKFLFAGGIRRSGLVRLNTDGSLDSSFNAPADLNPVYEIIVLADGKLLIGGGFPRGITRLNSDGTEDPTFNPGGAGTTGTVHSITAQSDGKFLISGSAIVSYNGVDKFSVVRINTKGSLDETFTNPFPSSQFVEQTAVQENGKIVIVGNLRWNDFLNVARLNVDGTIDGSFGGGEVWTNGEVHSVLVTPDNKILIGGEFTTVNGVSRIGLGRLNPDGTLDSTFNAQNSLSVESAAIRPNGQIVIAGIWRDNGFFDFFSAVAQFNPDGTLDHAFLPTRANDRGYHVALQPDGKIFLTGWFDDVGVPGLGRQNFVRLNPDGSVDLGFNSVGLSTSAFVSTMIEQSDGKIVAAGNFYSGNEAPHRSLVRFNVDGTVDETFHSGWGVGQGLTPYQDWFWDVSIAHLPDGKLMLGTTTVSGQSYNLAFFNQSLLRLNMDGTPDLSYEPTGILLTTSLGIQALLAEPDGKVIVAGESLVPGFPSKVMARLNPDGSLDETFLIGTAGLGSPRGLIRQTDGKVIAIGEFSDYSGSGRYHIVRVNTDGTVDATFNHGPNKEVLAAALQPDGKIVIGGRFTSYNGIPRKGLARIRPDGSLDLTFIPFSIPATGPNDLVRAIMVQPDGKIVIAGRFSTYNGVSANRIARLNPNGSLDTSAPSGLDDNPANLIMSGLKTADGQILIGGGFSNYGGVPRNNIAKLRIDGPDGTMFDYDGDGKTDLSVFRPSSGAWYLQRSTAGFQGLQFGADGDKLTPADYDGDGKTDIAVYRPSAGIWYILNSATGTVDYPVFGVAEDVPAPGDYDGDGKADVTVFRPSQGTWYRTNSSDGSFFGMQFGANGDVPTVGDFDGDGKNDLGIFRPSIGDWYNIRSSNGSVFGERFGQTADRIAPADYDGDGKTDIAIYRPSTGLWVIRNSATATYSYEVFGAPADIPIAGDYDGDGKADIGVWRPSDGTWYIKRSDNSQFIVFPWGQTGDKPTPSAYGN